MTPTTLEELDRSIEREQLRVTAEVFSDAWEEASAEGIAPELIAEAAAHALFARVLNQAGEERASGLLKEIGEAVACGQYLPETSIQ